MSLKVEYGESAVVSLGHDDLTLREHGEGVNAFGEGVLVEYFPVLVAVHQGFFAEGGHAQEDVGLL